MVSSHRAILQFASQFVLFLALVTSFTHEANAELIQNQFIPTTPPKPLAISFEDSQGNLVSIADFHGRYVLLNLWATWCGPCVHEMPALDKLRASFQPQHLQIVALSEDHDGLSAAKAFYTRHSLTHLSIYADSTGQVPGLLQLKGLPTTILIDPQGREIGRVEGEANWSAPDVVAFLETQIKH